MDKFLGEINSTENLNEIRYELDRHRVLTVYFWILIRNNLGQCDIYIYFIFVEEV